QLFFNKTLKETIEETVLTQAIQDKDLSVLKKYSKDKNPRIRKLVADSTLHLIESTPDLKEIDAYLSIFEDLVVDQNNEVVQTLAPVLKLVGLKYPLEKLYTTIQLGYGTELDVNVNEIQKILIEIGKLYPERMQGLYEFILKGYVPDKVRNSLMDILRILGQTYSELSYNIGMPMLDRKKLQLRIGAMEILKNLIVDFKPKFRQIYDKMKEIVSSEKNDPLRSNAIEIMAYIASMDQTFVEVFLSDYKKFKNLKVEGKEKIIGGLTKIIVSNPDKIDNILPDIIEELSMDKTIKQDIIMSLGVISMSLDSFGYLEKIHPLFKKFQAEKDENLKKWSINTFQFLYKARTDFLTLSEVRYLIISYLLDENTSIRKEMSEILYSLEDKHIVLDLFLNALINAKDTKDVKDDKFLSALYSKDINIIVENIQYLHEFLDVDCLNIILDDNALLEQIYDILISLNQENDDIKTLTTKIMCNIADNSLLFTEKSYKFLSSTMRGQNDEASAIVVGFFSKIVFEIQKNPAQYAIDLPFDIFYNTIKDFTKNGQILTQIACIKTLSEIYQKDTSKYEDIYNLLFESRTIEDNRIKPYIIEILTKISCDNQTVYLPDGMDSRWLEKSRLESEVLPLIFSNLNSEDENIQNAVINAFSLLTEKFGTTAVLKDFLINTIKKKKTGINEKKTVITCLTQIKENEVIDPEILSILKKLTNNTDDVVRESALRALTTIFISLDPKIAGNQISKRKYNQLFENLKHSIIRRKYMHDESILVRKTFIELATEVAIQYPDLEQPMLYIKDYAEDDNQEVAILAIQSYFKYIKNYPEKLETTAQHYLRILANTKSANSKDVLLKELLAHYTGGEDLKYYLPTLIKLALDKDKDIRKRSLKIFKEIYENTSEKLLYFIELLIKITRDRDPRIRIDAFYLVAELSFKYPKTLSEKNLVFDTFTRLSRDYDISVKLAVSTYLEDLIKIFPARLNNTLQIIYNLLRERNREIVNNCSSALRYVLLLFPERASEIKPMIERFYRRSASPGLQKLINEFSQ
ncbi:MAG: hypothetical protein GY870_18030, partial [archaeon]|nr:hypothetical protein [archaeon]